MDAERERIRADEEHKRANKLQSEIDLVLKKNQEIEKLIPKIGKKAPRRWYSIIMIYVFIRMVRDAAISFRAAPKAIHIVFSQFDAVKNQRILTNKSIARWISQIGLYKVNSPKEQASDWALIIDNSVQISTKKLLVILGVRLSRLQGKPLNFEDVETLVMELHDSSNETTVYKALEQAQNKVGKIVMVCADDGPDLRACIKLFCKKKRCWSSFWYHS